MSLSDSFELIPIFINFPIIVICTYPDADGKGVWRIKIQKICQLGKFWNFKCSLNCFDLIYIQYSWKGDDLTGLHLCKSNVCDKREKRALAKKKEEERKYKSSDSSGEVIIIDNSDYQEGDIKNEGNAGNSKSGRIV